MASFPLNKNKSYNLGQSRRNSIQLFSVNRTTIRSGSPSWSHCHCFVNADVDVIDIGLAFGIINFNYHLNQFSRHVTILFKMNVSAWNTFAETATACNFTEWSFVLTFDHSGLPQSDFSGELDFLIFSHTLNRNSHVVNDNTFFSGSDVTESCRPALKCFETEWDAVLAWSKTIALINQWSIFSEHVSGFIIWTLEVLILGCSDIWRAMIILPIVFWLRIRDNDRCLF